MSAETAGGPRAGAAADASAWGRYLFALLAVAVATALRAAVEPLWGPHWPALFHYGAVVLAAAIGGLGPGVVATLVSAALIGYFWLPRVGSFLVSDPTDAVGLVVFLVAGLLAAALYERQFRRMTAAVAALRNSEQRYRELFDRNLAGVLRTRRDGSIADCNRAFAALMGSTREDILHARVQDFYVDPRDREELMARLRRDGTLSAFDLHWRRRDGGVVWLRVNLRETEDGLLEGIMIDISDTKRREEAERSAAELRAIAKLATAAAHEINNPLAVVVGQLTLLRRHATETRRIDAALDAARRIEAIVRRMSQITRVESVEPTSPHLPPMLDIKKSSE